jgi:hypothetical protein
MPDILLGVIIGAAAILVPTALLSVVVYWIKGNWSPAFAAFVTALACSLLGRIALMIQNQQFRPINDFFGIAIVTAIAWPVSVLAIWLFRKLRREKSDT